MTKTLDLRHAERLETLVLHERTGTRENGVGR